MLKRLQVENQLDLGRLLHRQIFLPFKIRPREIPRGQRSQAQREASRVQRLKSIFNCLSSAMC
jgi:hypothetical protein